MNPFELITIQNIDITTLKVDAIVNAANSSLLGGGGVDGTIHKIAGPKLLQECKGLRTAKYPQGLSTGKAILTQGYELPAKYVIHTVGPIWIDGNHGEPQKLSDCYRNVLDICMKNRLRTVAFPAISTGIYGYPKEKAVKIVIDSVNKWVKINKYKIKIIFALINENYQIYKSYIERAI